MGAFGELPANPGLVDAASSNVLISEDLVEGVLLRVERLLAQFDNAAGETDIADFFNEPDDGQVPVAPHIDAEVEADVLFLPVLTRFSELPGFPLAHSQGSLSLCSQLEIKS